MIEIFLIDFINKFRKQKTDLNTNYAKVLNGYSPVYSQFGQDIFASDVVQQAISCIVTELTKLSPHHIRYEYGDQVPVNGVIQQLLDQPNERMSQSDFIEKVFWQLFLNYNSFIIPTYERTKEGAKVDWVLSNSTRSSRLFARPKRCIICEVLICKWI